MQLILVSLLQFLEQEFISYISSGWPDDPEIARSDLEGKLPDQFMERMIGTVGSLLATEERRLS